MTIHFLFIHFFIYSSTHPSPSIHPSIIPSLMGTCLYVCVYAYYVPGMVLGAGHVAMYKLKEDLVFIYIFLETTNKQRNKYIILVGKVL